MIRSFAVLAVLALGLNTVMAQDAAPAAPEAAPAASDIMVDPAAAIPAVPKQNDLMTGFFATMAVIEICAVDVPQAIKDDMAGDQKRLEASVGLDDNTAAPAYSKVKSAVQKTNPDCTPGSADLASVEAVTKIYADAAAQTTAAQTAIEAPATAPAQ
ncbi:MAG: hypothetical protein MO852_13435 [Candidatus Devosia euplotis]|nr:hypothetical protein [Candidatus Devosia euplotis]